MGVMGHHSMDSYLALAGGYHAGDASWPLSFPASLRNTVCSWPETLAFAQKGSSDLLICF